MTLSDEVEAFLEHALVIKGLSPATITAYRSDLLDIESFCKTSLLQCSEQMLFAYLATVKNRRTLNRRISAINSFYSYCHSEEWAHSVAQIHSAKAPKVLPKYLEYREIQTALQSIAKERWIDLRDRAIILTLYATGARVSELLAMTLADIQNEWVKIRKAKGSKERMVPIAHVAVEAIALYRAAVPFDTTNGLWVNYKGGALSRISVFKMCKKYLHASAHVLRHSYATSLILGGADLRVVQEMLGHESLLTTQVYTHIQQQHLYQTVQRYHPLLHQGGDV